MKLSEFLRDRREKLVRNFDFAAMDWSPTEGWGSPSAQSVDIIDFDALCDAIDEFQQELEAAK